MDRRMNINMEVFEKSELFAGIRKEEYPGMLQCIGAYTKQFEKSEYIFTEGGEISHIGFVLSGEVQMMKEDYWGQKMILTVVHSGDIFGESMVLGDLDSSIVSFKAVSQSEILFLPFRRVLSPCSHSCVFHLKLLENMVKQIAQKNVRLIEKMEIISKKTIRERILAYLSQNLQKSGEKYFISDMGRVDLADYLCVDRSALTRELSKMREEGIIDYDKNTFYLKR